MSLLVPGARGIAVAVQWCTERPGDWQLYDSAAFQHVPSRQRPFGGRGAAGVGVDGREGWIHRLCVQGVEFVGDHYAVEPLGYARGCKVTVWNDAVEDYPPGQRFAKEWFFELLGPEARLGGAINTRQRQIVYLDLGGPLHRIYAKDPIANTEFRDWSKFVRPPPAVTRHGKWVSDAHNAALEAAYRTLGWRQWVEGVAARELDGRGQLRSQAAQGRRPLPHGTRTYYLNAEDCLTSVHAALIQADENAMSYTMGTPTSDGSGSVGGGSSGILFVFTSDADQPNVAAWPTGDYEVSLDVSQAGSTITYGARNAGSDVGHFARVNAGLTSDLESYQMSESLWTGSGIKYGSVTSQSWSSGSAGDRFEICIAGSRPASHGGETITAELGDADSYGRGPWDEEAAGDTGMPLHWAEA